VKFSIPENRKSRNRSHEGGREFSWKKSRSPEIESGSSIRCGCVAVIQAIGESPDRRVIHRKSGFGKSGIAGTRSPCVVKL
jgi:hypothetical protein